MRVGIARDTWVSGYQDSQVNEQVGNNGGDPRLKTKGIVELALLDIDPAQLKGRVITGASLHIRTRHGDIQRRLTVSTVASDWVEGTGRAYRKQEGSACFLWARLNKQPWAYPGSDITAVIAGQGNTIWGFAEPSAPDARGWQEVAVEPRVVAARLAGISGGFAVIDDIGSEYERKGEKFIYHMFPNRYLFSRESGRANAPYLTVYLGEEDHEPPGVVGEVVADAADLPAGEVKVTWATPKDDGPAGTIGFVVMYTVGAQSHKEAFDWGRAQPVPRYLIPMAKAPGETVTMHLRGLGIAAGSAITLNIRAVDAVGLLGPSTASRMRVSDHAAPRLSTPEGGAKELVTPFSGLGDLPAIEKLKVFVIDPADKVSPTTGRMIPQHEAAYIQANHLWSAKRGLIRLQAAKNEFVSFQVVLEGQTDGAEVGLSFPQDGQVVPEAALLRFRHVAAGKEWLPDPLVPVDGPIAIPARDEKIEGQRFGSLLADVYVPHGMAAGTHHGKLTIKQGGRSMSLDVELRVWDFTLPDYLSFIPEMNTYGVPGPPLEVSYYRLAHAHRTCLNRVPYNRTGRVPRGLLPTWDGKKLNWKDFDRWFGPMFDGSAFNDLPRKGVPLDAFYLPISENQPMDLGRHFRGGYWADEAFDPEYRKTLVEVSRQYALHCKEKGWSETLFEFFLNGKLYYKNEGWSRATAPWVFDEPVNTQDFWAVRWYGLAFQEGVAPVKGDVKMAFRCDISRPQWQRDLLDGVLDVNVVGGSFRKYQRPIIDRKERNGEVTVTYGGSNAIESSNLMPVLWCIESWCLGADGVLPWQTMGFDPSWDHADEQAIFYPGGRIGRDEPVPSVRLKSYRRGQQDVEYLVLLSQVMKQPRWAVGRAALEALGVKAEFKQANSEDAGMVDYGQIDPVQVWKLRTRIGGMLDRAKPEPRRRLVDLRPALHDPANVPDLGYVTVAPAHQPVGDKTPNR